MTEPAWHPDPTGRNHYRWWDGSQWTDSVSNNGQVGVDPVQAQPTFVQQAVPQQAVPVQPHAPITQPPTMAEAPQPAMGASPVVKQKSNPLKIIIPVVAALAVGVVLFVVLGGGDDGGGGKFGVIDTELKTRDAVVTFEYKLQRGDAIRVRAEPEDRLDVVVSILTDRATARDYGTEVEDVLSDVISDFDDFLTDADDVLSDSDLGELGSFVVLQTSDFSSEGEPVTDFFLAFVDGTYVLALTSDEGGSRGTVRLIVEKAGTKVPIDDFDGFSDFDDFFSDEDDFFSDDDFFFSEDPFTP